MQLRNSLKKYGWHIVADQSAEDFSGCVPKTRNESVKTARDLEKQLWADHRFCNTFLDIISRWDCRHNITKWSTKQIAKGTFARCTPTSSQDTNMMSDPMDSAVVQCTRAS